MKVQRVLVERLIVDWMVQRCSNTAGVALER